MLCKCYVMLYQIAEEQEYKDVEARAAKNRTSAAFSANGDCFIQVPGSHRLDGTTHSHNVHVIGSVLRLEGPSSLDKVQAKSICIRRG